MIAMILTGITGVLHFGFMFLEMYLWTRPAALKIFRLTQDQAQSSAVLASNQGLYNGLLGAGLFWSLTRQPAEWAHQAQFFFFSSVVVAGIYGALTVNRRIFWVQAFPALLGIAALYFEI